MKKSKNMSVALSASLALIGIAGGCMYAYKKMHPIKSKIIACDAKNMMKDLM